MTRSSGRLFWFTGIFTGVLLGFGGIFFPLMVLGAYIGGIFGTLAATYLGINPLVALINETDTIMINEVLMKMCEEPK